MAILTAADVRERQKARVASEAAFPDLVLDDLIADFEQLYARYRGAAPETWTATQTLAAGTFSSTVVLDWPLVQSIDQILIDGDEWAGGYTLDSAAGIVHGLPCHGHLTLGYTHGPDEASSAVKRLCALYAAKTAVADSKADSGNAYAVVVGDAVERRSTPDWAAGRPTGWIDVDGGLNQLPDYRSGKLA